MAFHRRLVWALGRSRETAARSIEHSLVFGVYTPDTAEQLAFARVVTDYATFGRLCHVYVARKARGQGIGTWLAESVVAALGPYRLMLSTLYAHGVYARAGFAVVSEPEKLMMITASAPSTAPSAPTTGTVKATGHRPKTVTWEVRG